MAPGPFRFERFVLDPHDRQLRRDGAPVELNGRYLDALALLVGEQGRLVSKTRFHEEVWRGVPVTDEALTQCIRTLRRQLGDDAVKPRFIETVPKHGYRFIAPVTGANVELEQVMGRPIEDPAFAAPTPVAPVRPLLRLGIAGALGGAFAGMLGGVFYGLVGISDSLRPGGGALSTLIVIACLAMLLGLIGGAGVGFGVAAALSRSRHRLWAVVGGAAGGLAVGAVVKLIGLDAFDLLFGQSPGNITGAPEGALLGGAVGVGAWLALGEWLSPRRGVALAGLCAGVAGAVIPLAGGRLLGGSLALLADGFPASRLRLGQMGGLFGENGFGPVSQMVTSGLEGALFGACVVAAMLIARGRLR